MPSRALGLCRWAFAPHSPLHIVQAVGRQVIDEFSHEITAKDKTSGQCSVQVVRDGKMLECIITNPFPGSKMWLHWGFADRSRSFRPSVSRTSILLCRRASCFAPAPRRVLAEFPRPSLLLLPPPLPYALAPMPHITPLPSAARTIHTPPIPARVSALIMTPHSPSHLHSFDPLLATRAGAGTRRPRSTCRRALTKLMTRLASPPLQARHAHVHIRTRCVTFLCVLCVCAFHVCIVCKSIRAHVSTREIRTSAVQCTHTHTHTQTHTHTHTHTHTRHAEARGGGGGCTGGHRVCPQA